MDPHTIIKELSRNREVFKELLSGLSREEYMWKPQAGKWCLLEIICHLCDEELEDFRTRTRMVLDDPNSSPPPIDPESWVKERGYINKDFDHSLSKFLEERQRSVEWLHSLKSPNWENTYHHPKLGPFTAKKFLYNWLAHDYLHIRQINAMRFAYLNQSGGEDLSYAGNW